MYFVLIAGREKGGEFNLGSRLLRSYSLLAEPLAARLQLILRKLNIKRMINTVCKKSC